MSERRKRPRKRTGAYVAVHDLNSNENVGRLIDVSAEGMKLMSSKCFEKNSTLLLQIDLPSEIDGRGQILCKASIIWCKEGNEPDFHEVGLKISDISPYNHETLEKWMTSLAFQKSLKFAPEAKLEKNR